MLFSAPLFLAWWLLLLPTNHSLLRLALTGTEKPSSSASQEEEILKAVGSATDTPALLRYFQDRTPTAQTHQRLTDLIEQLGHRSFAQREKATRELLASGELALPYLDAARQNTDREISRRASECHATLSSLVQVERTRAVCRLLSFRRPPETCAILLAYLPHADWEALREPLFDTLAAVGRTGERGQQPVQAIVVASTDEHARRRAAAAHVLGQVTSPQGKLLERLSKDRSPEVRFHAGLALLRHRQPAGVLVLIELLEASPLPLAWQAEDLLLQLAGETAPAAREQTRQQWRASWDTWWRENQLKVDLASINDPQRLLGRTLIAEIEAVGKFPGRVVEYDRSGTIRWSMEGLESPTDVVLLGNDRFLVAEHWAQRITERNRQGKILWQYPVNNKPVSCARLPGGNTFIATYSEILILTPDGKTQFRHEEKVGMIYGACRVGRNVLYITSTGNVIELDLDGKEVRRFRPERDADGAAYWASIEPLPGGRYLICLTGAGKVVETDATGKILWECAVNCPCWASRLSNGHTLVAKVDDRSLVEVDRQGKEIWNVKTKGRPFRARRY